MTAERPSGPSCNCVTWGNASRCPVHTQDDFDAAELAREGSERPSGDYPYRTDALARLHDSGEWAAIPPSRVVVPDLTPTQPAVVIGRLIDLANGAEPETGDPYPHVVAHEGRRYVHDGHHRYVLALLTNQRVMDARVVDETGAPA